MKHQIFDERGVLAYEVDDGKPEREPPVRLQRVVRAQCCASSHEPPDTACRDFLAGQNGRCVYCDHEAKCHPGPGATCWIGKTERPQ